MAERDLIQQLDQAVNAMLAGAAETPVGPEVTSLLAIAVHVRELPGDTFRAGLKADLLNRAGQLAREKQQERERQNMTTATPSATSSTTWIREGFHSLTPYLHTAPSVNLMQFLKDVFGARERFQVPRPDGTMMHGEVTIGDSIVELADVPADWDGPRGRSLHIYVPDVDAAYERGLKAGGVSLYAPQDHEYGERSGAIKDPASNVWYVATAFGASHIPPGLRAVNIYLHVQGTPAYIEFLKQAFGGEQVVRHEAGGSVVHAQVRIGDSILEMGEARDQWQPMPEGIHHYVPDVDASYRRAVEAGAISVTPPADQPYGDRYACVLDSMGNHWYLASHLGRGFPGM